MLPQLRNLAAPHTRPRMVLVGMVMKPKRCWSTLVSMKQARRPYAPSSRSTCRSCASWSSAFVGSTSKRSLPMHLRAAKHRRMRCSPKNGAKSMSDWRCCWRRKKRTRIHWKTPSWGPSKTARWSTVDALARCWKPCKAQTR